MQAMFGLNASEIRWAATFLILTTLVGGLAGYYLFMSRSQWTQFTAFLAGALFVPSTAPEPDATKAEAYFERALVVARAQQAKSWELRVAMSMARL
jgi:hypothetical protein